jgi:mannose-6-phosphate isomerase-like protein (cupin superfamily)
MLEGHARFTIDERVVDAGPGDFLTVPKTTWHSFDTLTEVVLANTSPDFGPGKPAVRHQGTAWADPEDVPFATIIGTLLAK